MADSILNTTKKALNLDADYTAFDPEIIMHINSVFFTLDQLGIGPTDGFNIENSTSTWDEFIGEDTKLNVVQTYMYLRVRLLFDPPASSYAIASMEKQVEQFEFRLNVHHEQTGYIDPNTTLPHEDDDEVVFDGGGL